MSPGSVGGVAAGAMKPAAVEPLGTGMDATVTRSWCGGTAEALLSGGSNACTISG